jgi:hypothetical protein
MVHRSIMNPTIINNIIQIDEEITKADPKYTILFFDIDNTLFRTITDIGSDEWMRWQDSLLQQYNGNHKYLVINTRTALFEWYRNWMLTSNCLTELLEYETPKLLEKYSKMGFKIILITSRHKSLVDITIEQLKRHYDITHFYDNIFFTGGDHKGSYIKKILQTMKNICTKKIFFVDDSYVEINNVLLEFYNSEIDVKVMHYVFAQKFKQIFDNIDKDQLHTKWLESNEKSASTNK